MATRILKINYTRVAEHLCGKLEAAADPDMPQHTLTFDCVHGILSGLLDQYEEQAHFPFKTFPTEHLSPDGKHLTERYSQAFAVDAFPESKELTDILFEDLGTDHFVDATISNAPGNVAWVKGTPIVMPLVLITVS